VCSTEHTSTLFTPTDEPVHRKRRSRTIVAPPSSVVKCLCEVLVWGFGVLFLSCACVSVPGVLLSVGVCVCVCDLLIFLQEAAVESASVVLIEAVQSSHMLHTWLHTWRLG